MGKHLYNRILLSDKKKLFRRATHSHNMDESKMHFAKKQKAYTKGYIFHVHILYVHFIFYSYHTPENVKP